METCQCHTIVSLRRISMATVMKRLKPKKCVCSTFGRENHAIVSLCFETKNSRIITQTWLNNAKRIVVKRHHSIGLIHSRRMQRQDSFFKMAVINLQCHAKSVVRTRGSYHIWMAQPNARSGLRSFLASLEQIGHTDSLYRI